MGKIKRMIMAFALAAMIMLPTASTYASSVTFTNFTFQTYAHSESWNCVTSKAKADNEQAWYLTLASSSGLGSGNVPRAMAISYDEYPGFLGIEGQGLYSSTTRIGPVAYPKTVYKDSTYSLWVSGNQNNNSSYTIKISGRYSS